MVTQCIIELYYISVIYLKSHKNCITRINGAPVFAKSRVSKDYHVCIGQAHIGFNCFSIEIIVSIHAIIAKIISK